MVYNPGFQPSTWRLLQTPPANGAWNMAVDEAILEAVGDGEMLPTLRLFAWQPACLSLGVAQSISDVDKSALEQRGWHLVRRPTGGRAILHTDELTYSVIGPEDEPRLKGGVIESYRNLAQALLYALHRLGIPAQAHEKRAGIDTSLNEQVSKANIDVNPVCFEVPSIYEITFDGKKLIGSAQRRQKQGVLQHGSLPLTGDLRRITEVLHFEDNEARQSATERLLMRAITVESVLSREVSWEEAVGAFRDGFSEILNLKLIPEGLSERELQRAELLVREKYANHQWTSRV